MPHTHVYVYIYTSISMCKKYSGTPMIGASDWLDIIYVI